MPITAKHIIKDARKTPRTLSWPAALDTFDTHLRARRCAERTVKGYLLEVTYLRDHLGDNGSPADVTVQDLRDYQVGLLSGATSRTGKPISANTVARVTTQLASFFTFLHEEELIAKNPTLRLERPRVPPRAPGDVLTVKEVRRLLASPSKLTPHGLRDRALIELLYATGIRKAELRGLDLVDLDHNEREITVLGKGSKKRTIPLTRSAYLAVKDYLDRARPTLATKHPDSSCALILTERGRRIAETTIRQVLARLARGAGIAKRIKPHTMRRSFATHLLQSGASLRHIQALLGHESLNTTAIYLCLDPRDLRRELMLKHPRERLDV